MGKKTSSGTGKNAMDRTRRVVCIRLSDTSALSFVRFDMVKRDDGSVLTAERPVPKLTHDTNPSFLLNCPSDLSKYPPEKRKRHEKRCMC